MRVPVFLLAVSLLGVVGGAFLIGTWAAGCAVIFDSLCLGAWAMWGYDDGTVPGVPQVHEAPLTVQQILERARRAS